MGKAIPDDEPVILDLPVSRLPRVGLDGGGVVQEFMQALPIDLVSVGYDGLVVAASLSHTVRPLAGADYRDCVIGAPFEAVLERLPLDDGCRRELHDQLTSVLHGEVVSATRCYPLLASDPDMLTVHIAKISGHAGMLAGPVIVALQGERSAVGERCSRRAYQARLLRAQDEERRRIARDLHDGTAQHLALAQVMLETVRKARTFEAIETACLDIESALGTAQHQMRTLSYVLHPPELEEAGGIVEALSSFLKGFARRTGLSVRFHNLAGYLKPSADLEIALYRVAQEALVNVGKHAFASTVEVRLRRIAKYLALEIEDDGVGISNDILEGRMREAVGVGLSGMRERVEGLGGMFCVERRLTGTHVGAYFPQRRAEDRTAGRLANPGSVPESTAVTAQRYCFGPRRERVPPSS